MAAIALSETNADAFARLVNEVASAPQNQLDATSVERMAAWAVASQAYTNQADFVERFKDAPFRTLIEWGSLGYYASTSLSGSDVGVLDTLVNEVLNQYHDRPLDQKVAELLLPVFQSAGFLTNSTVTAYTLAVYPYATLMAFAWWMNVTDSALPFVWCNEKAALELL